MRRRDKQLTRHEELEEIIRRGEICHLAFSDEDIPYVIPINYGYSENSLYFHSAPEGRKIDIIRKNNIVAFAITADTAFIKAENACGWGMRFNCVTGTGRAVILTEKQDKLRGLAIIMSQYDNRGPWEFDDKSVDKTVVIRLEIAEMTGKRSGL